MDKPNKLLNSGCLPSPYSSWQTFPERKTSVNEIMKAGPLCGSNYCPRPITFPDVNYNINQERSPFDNRFGCNAYDKAAQNSLQQDKFSYKY